MPLPAPKIDLPYRYSVGGYMYCVGDPFWVWVSQWVFRWRQPYSVKNLPDTFLSYNYRAIAAANTPRPSFLPKTKQLSQSFLLQHSIVLLQLLQCSFIYGLKERAISHKNVGTGIWFQLGYSVPANSLNGHPQTRQHHWCSMINCSSLLGQPHWTW